MPKQKEKPKKRTEHIRPEKQAQARSITLGEITFKKPEILALFMSSRFKILPAKKTGVTARKQKKLSNEIKKARLLALLPFTDRHSIR